MPPVKPSSEISSEQARDQTRVTCVVSEHANRWPTGSLKHLPSLSGEQGIKIPCSYKVPLLSHLLYIPLPVTCTNLWNFLNCSTDLVRFSHTEIWISLQGMMKIFLKCHDFSVQYNTRNISFVRL